MDDGLPVVVLELVVVPEFVVLEAVGLPELEHPTSPTATATPMVAATRHDDGLFSRRFARPVFITVPPT